MLTQTWTSVLALIRRVQAAMNDAAPEASERANRLVLNGTLIEFRAQMEQASPFSLWDRLCQQSVFYPSTDTRLPSIRRARVLDAVLGRDGHPAVFATLTEQEVLEVGNAVMNLLRARLGDDGVESLMSGSGGLRALGLEEEVMSVVEGSVGVVIEPERAGLVPAPPRVLSPRGPEVSR